MIKEDVLKLEYQDVFDMVAVRIKYQNEEVLKRGEFEDEEIKVASDSTVEFKGFWSGYFFIRGTDRDYDNRTEIISKEQAEEIKEKVKLINKKYGIKKRWEPEYEKSYCYIDSKGEIGIATWYDDAIDSFRFEMGNIFKTQEQAERALKHIKKALNEFWEQEVDDD